MNAKSILLSLVGLTLLSLSPANAEIRTWTRKSGKTLEAEFVKMEKDGEGHNIVTLRKADGKEVKGRLATFSEEDRKYIRERAGLPANLESKETDAQKPTEQPAPPASVGDSKNKSPGDQPATPPEKTPESSAESTTKPTTGEGLFAKIAAQREHEKQTVEALTAALEGFPLNCLKAEVVGEPKDHA